MTKEVAGAGAGGAVKAVGGGAGGAVKDVQKIYVMLFSQWQIILHSTSR